jgi:hypothetical protein
MLAQLCGAQCLATLAVVEQLELLCDELKKKAKS